MDNSTITTISIRNFKGIEDLQLNKEKSQRERETGRETRKRDFGLE